jgi:hypothetical protein
MLKFLVLAVAQVWDSCAAARPVLEQVRIRVIIRFSAARESGDKVIFLVFGMTGRVTSICPVRIHVLHAKGWDIRGAPSKSASASVVPPTDRRVQLLVIVALRLEVAQRLTPACLCRRKEKTAVTQRRRPMLKNDMKPLLSLFTLKDRERSWRCHCFWMQQMERVRKFGIPHGPQGAGIAINLRAGLS